METKDFPQYASVVLEVSVDKTLDYGIPDHLLGKIQRGSRVEVPLRGSLKPGYVIAIKDIPSYTPVKGIVNLLNESNMITPPLFDLALWMARYYCSPLRQVFKTILPASVRKNPKQKEQYYVTTKKSKEHLKQYCISIRNRYSARAKVIDAMLLVKKGILLTELLEKTGGTKSPVDALVKDGFLFMEKMQIDRSPLSKADYFKTKPKNLNQEQAETLERIQLSLIENRFETHLIHGVTGSGKTEIYLQAIDTALQQNKGTIMLVPEIALTAQTIERFRSRFDHHIAVLHYRLSHGERYDEWKRIKNGTARIVIGARSAIFSPVPNLGLFVIDEEHENSYKQQDEMPCYNARDVAVIRGKMESCPVILGSATPSLESFYNAEIGKYTLSQLHNRPNASTMPTVTIIDMKKEYEKAKGYTNFSGPLIDGIKKRIELGEQSILFLNRRGYHTTMFCTTCRQAIGCKHCDVVLTFHLGNNTLACHLCGFSMKPPRSCPSCKGEPPLRFRGVGTEQVERALHAIIPDVRTLRMDADTTRHKGSHERLFRAFGTGKADVLIGTQMIAKGLHFPQVTLVGVLNCDSALNIPDFRASENVFQLITQVSGRAGRGITSGEVILQTSMPDHSIICHAANNDFKAFYEEEKSIREMFHYPPYDGLIKMSFSGKKQQEIEKYANSLRNQLIKMLPATFEIQPVVPGGYAKVKDKFRYQLFIKGKDVYRFNEVFQKINLMKNPSIKTKIDTNPLSTFF